MFGSAIAFAQIRRPSRVCGSDDRRGQSKYLGSWMIKRRTIDKTPSFSIRELRGAGLLEEGVETLHLGGHGEGHIQIAWIAGPAGGQRAHFVCPDCSKQVEILYAAPHLACRRCHSLDFT